MPWENALGRARVDHGGGRSGRWRWQETGAGNVSAQNVENQGTQEGSPTQRKSDRCNFLHIDFEVTTEKASGHIWKTEGLWHRTLSTKVT